MTTFRIATEADDALVRSLLHDNGMPAWVEMAIEREPSFSASKSIFGQEWAVVAEEDGDVVGMYTAALLPVHVDGRPERLGYLGGLRVCAKHRRRIRHLRAGYDSIRRLAPATASLPWWFTVVASENQNARRLLESGVRGLPAYYLQGEYRTFALPAARGRRRNLWRPARVEDVSQIVAFHNDRASRFQCSPVLSDALIRRIGIENFYLFEPNGVLHGAVALWDQRAFKQIVARRYRRPIGALLRPYNFYAKMFRRIPLPREGGALQQTFMAFLALSEEAHADALALLEDLLAYCKTPVASLGLHAESPLIVAVDRLRPLPYPARIYAVSFESEPPGNGRPVQPEAALL
ncbi:MAG TPA: hypothetical protein VEZ11_02285 [Thermoanaerobaculia bacterium]|nr:hypothetical protein [Thermoanaerobaculia bacterium]